MAFCHTDFWTTKLGEVDFSRLGSDSIQVKGTRYRQPNRCLEIFGNTVDGPWPSEEIPIRYRKLKEGVYSLDLEGGGQLELGPQIPQPPYSWGVCDSEVLIQSFSYTTNAVFRVLDGLAKINSVPAKQIDVLLDEVCKVISRVYRIDNGHFAQCINNNVNMYIISKSVEAVVGKAVYDCVNQEPTLASNTLYGTLRELPRYICADLREQIALAIGRGFAQYEHLVTEKPSSEDISHHVFDQTVAYSGGRISIDNRNHFIGRLNQAEEAGGTLRLCVILDDVSESVFDLCWIQQAIMKYSCLSVYILVNVFQVSINVSSRCLSEMIKDDAFRALREYVGKRVFIRKTECPLISFQMTTFSSKDIDLINKSDIVYVKGLNFFETCQIRHKEVYYSFVVYGPTSQQITGLNDLESVFAFVPAGEVGYSHSACKSRIITLADKTRLWGHGC